MGFNGAAGVNPRMAHEAAPELQPEQSLQWGRGCEPADGACPTVPANPCSDASMGPRV